MTTLATLVVKIVGDVSEYSDSLNKSREMTQAFSQRAVSGLSAVGGTVVMGALAGASLATLALGTMTWKAANTIDAAYDTIQIQTGATGAALTGLQGTFDRVFSQVPTQADTAASVIGALNARLGLTGGALEENSVKLLQMTELLGGDASQNAALFTRVIGDWSVPLDDSGGLLDKLFMASQRSGVGVERLMANVVQFGAPLRQMGFNLDESIALFAKWEKEGVNAELVMGSLRIAAGNFARDGKPLREGLLETMAAIKGAASSSEALTIAMDVFGARAGPDMAAAIREGRFDIEDMVAALGDADGVIASTTASTEDWQEKWQKFTNSMTVNLAPIGSVLMQIAGKALDMMAAFLSRPDVQTFIATVSAKIQEFGTAVLDWMPKAAEWIQKAFAWLGDNQGMIVAALAAIGVAVAAFVYTTVIPAAVAMISATWPVLLVMLAVAAVAYLVYQAWTNNWGGIQEKTQAVIEFIKRLIAQGLALIQAWWSQHGVSVMTVVQGLWNGIVAVFTFVWGIIQGIVQVGLNIIQAIWKQNGSAIMAYLQNVWGIITTYFSTVFGVIGALFDAFAAAFSGDWRGFGENLRVAWDLAWKGLIQILSLAWANIKIIFSQAIKNVVDFFTKTDWKAVGKNIIDGIVNGLKNAIPALVAAAVQAAQAALDAVEGFFDMGSPSRVMEDRVGWQMGMGQLRGYARSMRAMITQMPNILGPVVSTAAHASSGGTRSAPASASTGGGGLVLNMYGGTIELRVDGTGNVDVQGLLAQLRGAKL